VSLTGTQSLHRPAHCDGASPETESPNEINATMPVQEGRNMLGNKRSGILCPSARVLGALHASHH
jgi:hypothetical protein